MGARATDVKIIKIACLIRTYVYTATISNKTGKLLGIRAGCRRWKTFDEARNHYSGNGRIPSWSDRNVAEYPSKYAQRAEARAILDRLNNAVIVANAKIRRRKRAVR